jgi:gamma-glutamylcyclotransferase (GGCT)/AIG2-like uncharacterized protein YtfP
MAVIQYFAYGSNMLTARLQARCASAQARSVVRVDDYKLSFFKKGRDGSGKAMTSKSAGGRVFGVVFDLDESDLASLDRFEGVGQGYDRVGDFTAHNLDTGKPLDAVTYIANPDFIVSDLKPYDWYLNLVIAGARHHALPSDYAMALTATPSTADPEPDRPWRQEALELLAHDPEKWTPVFGKDRAQGKC